MNRDLFISESIRTFSFASEKHQSQHGSNETKLDISDTETEGSKHTQLQKHSYYLLPGATDYSSSSPHSEMHRFSAHWHCSNIFQTSVDGGPLRRP
jgi:hypothetical protein